MSEELLCPKCGEKLDRKLGLPGVILTCKCGKDWVLCLGKLISREEFHVRADAEHY